MEMNGNIYKCQLKLNTIDTVQYLSIPPPPPRVAIIVR